MANITIKNPAEYDNKVRKLETTDKAHADIFNGIFEKLVNNQEFLKLITDEAIKHMETSEIHVTTENKRYWDDKAETSTATQSENGLMSNIDKTKLDHIADKAEVNQNAISSISAGGSVIEANSKTAQIAILPGSDNVTVTGDNATKQVKISVSGGNADTLGGRAASELSVNYASAANYANSANNANYATRAGELNIEKVSLQLNMNNCKNSGTRYVEYTKYGTVVMLSYSFTILEDKAKPSGVSQILRITENAPSPDYMNYAREARFAAASYSPSTIGADIYIDKGGAVYLAPKGGDVTDIWFFGTCTYICR